MPGLIIEEDDVCVFATEKCNSNCIMCPMSMDSRKRGLMTTHEDWVNMVSQMPDDPAHITITGGEPFLDYKNIFLVMEQINRRFPRTEVLILTNGRALSIKTIFDQLSPLITEQYCFAIPIHASKAELHDQITQSQGSFRQTMKALKELSEVEARIEVRIVGHQQNLNDLNNIYYMLTNTGMRFEVINLIAMEMMGCAARNRHSLWVEYDKLCKSAEKGIQYALIHGIDVGLYNFPLCMIPENLWPLAKHSITPSKVRFYDACYECREHNACGGLFYSTYELDLCHIKPIKGSGER